MTYWKILSMIYSLKTASWMKGDVLYDIRNVSILLHQLSHPNFG